MKILWRGSVPDGYYENGDSRPTRKIVVEEEMGLYCRIIYCDTRKTATCPRHTIVRDNN